MVKGRRRIIRVLEVGQIKHCILVKEMVSKNFHEFCRVYITPDDSFVLVQALLGLYSKSYLIL